MLSPVARSSRQRSGPPTTVGMAARTGVATAAAGVAGSGSQAIRTAEEEGQQVVGEGALAGSGGTVHQQRSSQTARLRRASAAARACGCPGSGIPGRAAIVIGAEYRRRLRRAR